MFAQAEPGCGARCRGIGTYIADLWKSAKAITRMAAFLDLMARFLMPRFDRLQVHKLPEMAAYGTYEDTG